MHQDELRLERLENRVTALEGELADARVEQARTAGQLEILSGAYDRAANVVASQAIADAEVRRSTATQAATRDQAAEGRRDRKAWRQLAGAIAALLAALAAAVGSGKC